MSSLIDPLVGTGGVVVAAGAAIVGVGVAENADSHHSAWFNCRCPEYDGSLRVDRGRASW